MQKAKHKSPSLFWVALLIGKLKRRIKKTRHRRYVLEEWLNTELSFGKELEAALQWVKNPMEKVGLLDRQTNEVLFPEFQGMLQLSKEMTDTVSIIRRVKNPNQIIFGEKLLKFATFYKLYGTYFGNRLKCSQLLSALHQSHPSEMTEIESTLKDNMRKLDERKGNTSIIDLLAQPQYRMFKYVLLLKDYLRKLPRSHKDWQPLSRALSKFEEINLANNELMGRLQAQDKKVKLDRLFGKSIGNNSEYQVEMAADSLYSPVKLYIFNNLIIIANVDSTLGVQQERRYLNLALNEFSFVHPKPDGKYYKNVLLLGGQYDSLHCFLPDPGTRQEILIAVGKVVRELQVRAVARRQQRPAIGQQVPGKISISLEVGKTFIFASQLRVQVLKVEVRPLGTFSNDTVYLTRFMGPLHFEDAAAVGGGGQQSTGSMGVWQLAELHLSQVVELLKQLREQYPQIQFPEIDPLTKQVNAFTQGKKNTKMFEVRSYLLEQFFNFLFRHPTIMLNPLWLVRKHKLSSPFFQHLAEKNDYLVGKKGETRQEIGRYRYGATHCPLCATATTANSSTACLLRRNFANRKRTDFCFNAFCLLRLRICQLPSTYFMTSEHLLIRELYQAGRLDYSLLPREDLHKKYQLLQIKLSDRQISACTDYRRKVGEVLVEIGRQLGLDHVLDYRLILKIQTGERVLDQDEVLFDLIVKHSIEATEREDENRPDRQTLNPTSIQKEEGFFSFLSKVNIFSSKSTATLTLKKHVYLTKELELKGLQSDIRAFMLIEELYSRLKSGEIPLEVEDIGQACALWLVLNYQGKQEMSKPGLGLGLISSSLLPVDRRQLIRSSVFQRNFNDTCQQFKDKPVPRAKDLLNLQKRILRVFYRSMHTYTYLVAVTPRTVPESMITDGKGPIQTECWLGVNYRQLIVLREKDSIKPSIRLQLEDVRVTMTTFSVFIEYSYFLSSPQNSNLSRGDMQSSSLRFDARVLFHFDTLLAIYRGLKRSFPQIMA